MPITTVPELEDVLSTPTPADVAAAKELKGDVLILGAGGKMGPSLAKLIRRAILESGRPTRVIAIARFSDSLIGRDLDALGVETIGCDLLEPGVLGKLPDTENVIFMAARKFGTSGSEYLTWAMNTLLPGLVAERYRSSRIVAFSTGNVYGVVPVGSGGSTEDSSVAPVGEYAQSALGRERMFEYGSSEWGTPVVLLRLNYAVELRYGVLVDIADAVFNRRSVDLRMGHVNVIWQRDANSVCFRSLAHCASPPLILNVTGPEILSVREIANEFGRRFGVVPTFEGEEANEALLNNSAKAVAMFGQPTVKPDEMIDWIAHWIAHRNPLLNKRTHFEVVDGKF